MSTSTKPRILYFDILRILSAFFVIMIHVSAQYWYEAPVTSSQWQFMSAYDIIGMAGVPIFFMLSGALLLDTSKDTDFKKLFKKVLALIIIYHLWLTFYNLEPFFIGKNNWTDFSMREIFYNVFTGTGAYHLWFLPELTLLYVISPILKEIFRSRTVCKYYLVLYIVLGLVMPGLLLFDFPYKTIINSLYSRSSLTMLTGYIGYFVLGHYIHEILEIKDEKKIRIVALLMIVVGYTITISINAFDAIKTGAASTLANTPLVFSEFLSACGIFVLAKCVCKSTKLPLNFLTLLSSLTFGIYLIHPFIISILMKLGLNTMVPHTCIMIPVYTFAVFVLSGIIVFVIKKIPVLKLFIKI